MAVMIREGYKRLGEYIEPVDERNSTLSVKLSQGICNNKYFITPRQVAENSANDKIVRKGQFAYNRATTRNGDKISIAYREGDDCTVSSAYQVFRIIDENKLNPHYLWMWFRRPEFDRYARFKSRGSAHEFFEWDEMCDVYLPVPDIDVQRRIVAEYQAVDNRIANNERLISKLEETSQNVYDKYFGCISDSEELPVGWSIGKLSDIASYVKTKIDTDHLTCDTYISTENMLKDRGGITPAKVVPAGRCTEFHKGQILISNIRPYFKKIWMATFDGGCSTDVLCLSTNEGYQPEFVYGAIVKDDFFDYVMAGSNGVKMPRGDKDWIMKYPVCVPSPAILEDYNNKAKKILSYQKALMKENATLLRLKQLLVAKISQQ